MMMGMQPAGQLDISCKSMGYMASHADHAYNAANNMYFMTKILAREDNAPPQSTANGRSCRARPALPAAGYCLGAGAG